MGDVVGRLAPANPPRDEPDLQRRDVEPGQTCSPAARGRSELPVAEPELACVTEEVPLVVVGTVREVTVRCPFDHDRDLPPAVEGVALWE